MSVKVSFTEKLGPQSVQTEQTQNNTYTKTNDYPSDSVELSTKEDKSSKKSLYLKIAGTIAILATIVGGIFMLRRGRSSQVAETMERGKNRVNEVADDISRRNNSKTDIDAEARAKAEAEARLKAEAEARAKAEAEAKAKAEAEKLRQQKLEEAKLQREQVRLKDATQSINKSMDIFYEKHDDEIAELIYNHYKAETFPSIKFADELVKDRTIVDKIINEAIEKAIPLEKERLMTKLFELKHHKIPVWDSYHRESLDALVEFKAKFQELYQTPGVEFKGGMVEKIGAKIEEVFQSTKAAKNLRDITGSDVDYELFKKLLKKSESYEDIWHKKTNPMSQIDFMYDKKKIVLFLDDALPKLIKEEKNLLKQEDLWMKYFKTHKQSNNNITTHEDFEILKQMQEALYKDLTKLPNGKSFKYQQKVEKEINNLIDEYIFKKFDIPEIKSKEEIMTLANKVIKKGNSWYTLPENIDYKKVANALYEMGKEAGNEKYYQAALNLAKNNKANDYANSLIEKILKDERISPEFKQSLEKLSQVYKEQASVLAKEVVAKFEAGTLDETFETLKANPEIMKAIKELSQKKYIDGQLTEAQILEKFKQGDYSTIYSVIDSSSIKTPKDSKFWDDMIHYLGKIDGLVKNPEELERLKNVRALLIGNKVLELRKTNPDMANAYMEVLKTELRDILYKKGNVGELSENLRINEELIDRTAEQISEIVIQFNPTTTVFGALDRLLEREIQFRAMGSMAEAYAKVNNHKLMSDELFEAIKLKRQEVKTRLKIRTEDDFYQDYYDRYRKGAGASSSKLGRESAIDILNKYLPDDAKLKPDAVDGDIKRAYRELALKYHPDRAATEEEKVANEAIFKEIGDAYSVLKE